MICNGRIKPRGEGACPASVAVALVLASVYTAPSARATFSADFMEMDGLQAGRATTQDQHNFPASSDAPFTDAFATSGPGATLLQREKAQREPATKRTLSVLPANTTAAQSAARRRAQDTMEISTLNTEIPAPNGNCTSESCSGSPCVMTYRTVDVTSLGDWAAEIAQFDLDSDESLTAASGEVQAACAHMTTACTDNSSVFFSPSSSSDGCSSPVSRACGLVYNTTGAVATSGPCHFLAQCEAMDTFYCACTPGFSGAVCNLTSTTAHVGTDIDDCEFTTVSIELIAPPQNGAYIGFRIAGVDMDDVAVILAESDDMSATYANTFCRVPPGTYDFQILEPIDGTCLSDYGFTMGSYAVTVGGAVVLSGDTQCGLRSTFEVCRLDDLACASSPCQNNATCIPECNGYRCACPEGFEGPLCEFVTADECVSSPCENGGVCIDMYRSFECLCVGGYVGARCENAMVTQYDPNTTDCTFAAIKVSVTAPKATGFASAISFKLFSESEVLLEEDAQSLGWGDRSGMNADYTAFFCSVTPGDNYTFEIIDRFRADTLHAVPSAAGNYPMPVADLCASNWGPDIDQGAWQVDVLLPTTTHNLMVETTVVAGSGHISPRSATTWCSESTSFSVCTPDAVACESAPCMNGGVCIDECDGSFSCRCAEAFEGTICSVSTVDECLSSPCLNGGECIDLAGGFQCTCRAGYTGVRCGSEGLTVYNASEETCPFFSLTLSYDMPSSSIARSHVNWQLQRHSNITTGAFLAGADARLRDSGNVYDPFSGANCYEGYVTWNGVRMWHVKHRSLSTSDGREGSSIQYGYNAMFGMPNGIWYIPQWAVWEDAQTSMVEWRVSSQQVFGRNNVGVADGIIAADGTFTGSYMQTDGAAPDGVDVWMAPCYSRDMDCGTVPRDGCGMNTTNNGTGQPCQPDESVKSCSQLGWATLVEESICAGIAEPALGTFLDAVTTCAKAGGRLCSAAELRDDVLPVTSSTASVWSSTRAGCAVGQAEAVDPGGLGQCTSTQDLLELRCCADAAPTRCSDFEDSLCLGGSSLLTCKELGWVAPENHGYGHVCAEADLMGFGIKCYTSTTFAEAASICMSTGARLCTTDELASGELWGVADQCGIDGRRVWSSSRSASTGCTGHHTILGTGNVATVLCGETAAAVVCCADADHDTCSPSTGDLYHFNEEHVLMLDQPEHRHLGETVYSDALENYWTEIEGVAHIDIGVCNVRPGSYTFHFDDNYQNNIASSWHGPDGPDDTYAKLVARYDNISSVDVLQSLDPSFTINPCLDDPCQANPCVNGVCTASCLVVECICPIEWAGADCSMPNPCHPLPCADEETCQPNADFSGHECVRCGASGCSSTCGNGIVDSTEACDDGNLDAADGCSCPTVESGWMCEQQPSLLDQPTVIVHAKTWRLQSPTNPGAPCVATLVCDGRWLVTFNHSGSCDTAAVFDFVQLEGDWTVQNVSLVVNYTEGAAEWAVGDGPCGSPLQADQALALMVASPYFDSAAKTPLKIEPICDRVWRFYSQETIMVDPPYCEGCDNEPFPVDVFDSTEVTYTQTLGSWEVDGAGKHDASGDKTTPCVDTGDGDKIICRAQPGTFSDRWQWRERNPDDGGPKTAADTPRRGISVHGCMMAALAYNATGITMNELGVCTAVPGVTEADWQPVTENLVACAFERSSGSCPNARDGACAAASKSTCHQVMGTNNDDVVAMHLIRDNLIGDAVASWNEDDDPCSWKYVTCTGSRVTALVLSGSARISPGYVKEGRSRDIRGTLSQAVTNLHGLKMLQISDNDISGTIPDEVFSMPQMQSIAVAYAPLSGTMPALLECGPRLAEIVFTYTDGYIKARNLLSGSLPVFHNCGGLQAMNFRFTNIEGDVPPSLGFTDLRYLLMGMNPAFKGTGIPETWKQLSKMTEYTVFGTQMGGTLPSWLVTSWPKLSALSAWGNDLSGTLPDALPPSLMRIGFLQLKENHLSGTLPASWSVGEWREGINLNSNELSGTVPPEWGDTKPEWIYITENRLLSGTLPARVAAISNMKALLASNTRVSGTLPIELVNNPSLRYVSLAKCYFSGELPGGDTWNAPLRRVDLSSNFFEGNLPAAMGDVSTFELLDFTGNPLAATVESTTVLTNVVANSPLLTRLNVPLDSSELSEGSGSKSINRGFSPGGPWYISAGEELSLTYATSSPEVAGDATNLYGSTAASKFRFGGLVFDVTVNDLNSGLHYPLECVDNRDGTYAIYLSNITWVTTLHVNVLLDSSEFQSWNRNRDSHIHVKAGPLVPIRSRVLEALPEVSVAGVQLNMTIVSCDEFGNIRAESDGDVCTAVFGTEVAVVHDNADGTYSLLYTPVLAGPLTLEITIRNELISGMPTAMYVAATEESCTLLQNEELTDAQLDPFGQPRCNCISGFIRDAETGLCEPCPLGYYSNAPRTVCLDVNECNDNNGGCDTRATKLGPSCINFEGAHSCGSCPDGLFRNSTRNDEDRLIGAVCVKPPPPPPGDTSVAVVVEHPQITLVVSADETVLEPNSEAQVAFIDQVVADLATSLLIPTEAIRIDALRRDERGNGRRFLQSTTVDLQFDFTVLASTSNATAIVAEIQQQLQDPTSPLMNGDATSALDATQAVVASTVFECPAGSAMSNGQCARCPPGKWSKTGQPCIPCSDPTTMIPSGLADSCICDRGFHDAAVARFVCFDGGYDADEFAVAMDSIDSSIVAGQQCQECPRDGGGRECMVCAAGALPTVSPGFKRVQLSSSAYRRLSAGERVTTVFACHTDKDIAARRCPSLGDEECAEGYRGILCSTCEPDWGMVNSRCQPCEESGVSVKSLLLLVAMLFGMMIVVIGGIKMWDAFPIIHAARCAFQPMRIVFTYAQVTSQLGDVLEFNLPPIFGSVIDALRPIMDIWGLLFRALGSSECFGLVGFSSRWWLRVVVMPLILTAVVGFMYAIERCRNVSSSVALTHAKGNAFLAIFFCYPTICTVVFASFICKQITPDDSILATDDSIMCEDPGHVAIQTISTIVIVLFAVGVPAVFGFVVTRNARQYAKDTQGINALLARQVAEELEVDEQAAEFVIRDVIIGADYAFMLDAFSPQYMYWESLDMLRKLILVGLVLLVGRGSVAQLSAAILISFAFFALQVRVSPYKIQQDNTYRALTEFHVFIVIVCAMVLEKTDITREGFTRSAYDWTLFITWLACVPGAFFVIVISKLRFVKSALYGKQKGPRRAFDRCYLGLKSGDDVLEFNEYLEHVRRKVQGESFARVLEGKGWQNTSAERRHFTDNETNSFKARLDKARDQKRVEGSLAAAVDPEPEHARAAGVSDDEIDSYYSNNKFDAGFTGTFADMSDYYGGLESMIGECRKDLMQAMQEEHCNVLDGFGQSDKTFKTSSYRVETTPAKEWNFVVNPDQVGDMPAGIDKVTGESRGTRTKRHIQDLRENAAHLLTESFREGGIDVVVTEEQVQELPLLAEEIIALRLYTGPMFEQYNSVLRAWGNSKRGYVPDYSPIYPGEDVRDRFTTTLHVMNSGVLKLSRLQAAVKVFRGISKMRLPQTFTVPNELNVRGGVEYGFMSTTVSESVALSFAKDNDKSTASTLVQAEMGMVDRGASLSWLSQYPHEREILLPPLTAMEVKSIDDITDDAGFKLRKVAVRLNCNMMSMPIEKLLAVRKKQVQELCSIVETDMSKHNDDPDITKRVRELEEVNQVISAEEPYSFNDNAFFEESISGVMSLMPKLGDALEVLTDHTMAVYGLVAVDDHGSFASSSWDSSAKIWTLNAEQSHVCTGTTTLPGASIVFQAQNAAGKSRDMNFASGMFDGAISLNSLSLSRSKRVFMGEATLLTLPHAQLGDVGAISSLAWHSVVDTTEPTALGLDARMQGGSESPRTSTPPRRTSTPPRAAPATSALASDAAGVATKPSVRNDLSEGTPRASQNMSPKRKIRAVARVITSPSQAGEPSRRAQIRALVQKKNQSSCSSARALLASGTMTGKIMLWDVNESKLITEANRHTATVRALQWTTVGGELFLVSASFDRRIIVWRVVPTKSTRGGSALSYTLEESVQLTDTGCKDCDRAGTAHKGAITTMVSVSANNQLLASGSEDGAVKVWDLTSKSAPFTLMNSDCGVCTLAWIPRPATNASKSWLASGMGDNSIVLCDLETGDRETVVTGHAGPVHSLLWLDEKGWLVSGSADSTIRTWRVRTDTV